jgi:hypothetical protein
LPLGFRRSNVALFRSATNSWTAVSSTASKGSEPNRGRMCFGQLAFHRLIGLGLPSVQAPVIFPAPFNTLPEGNNRADVHCQLKVICCIHPERSDDFCTLSHCFRFCQFVFPCAWTKGHGFPLTLFLSPQIHVISDMPHAALLYNLTSWSRSSAH